MPMKYPVHPGIIIKHDCMDALKLNVTNAAKILGVSRTALSRVINGKASISPEMAIRVSKAFGSTPEHWLRMQLAYDVSQMRNKVNTINIERYHPSSV
ncbi:MAG: addiction module antidote protein, HigA family [Candidatus Scalindua sp. AMX11]|nr:HigA family addiction module antidote protein [Planctomycetota bacterium]RZV61139.1 MAG: addiction module antidote protein, HigA family [Candidatus Scalindua sp. SCAELEC01]TDE63172.1 MAG: addiction module antidote protein, HigA family [Candidatus Scalindua sp. AMX11]GJQ57410.1 MAG: transcriptional regulator [Candidatus Scalindua sp.]